MIKYKYPMDMSWLKNFIETLSLKFINKFDSHSIKKNKIYIKNFYYNSPQPKSDPKPASANQDQAKKPMPVYALGVGDMYSIVVDVTKIRKILSLKKWDQQMTGRFVAKVNSIGSREWLSIAVEAKNYPGINPAVVSKELARDIAIYVFGDAYKKFGGGILPEVNLMPHIDNASLKKLFLK